jgi:iron complex outermembrane receptor protein
MYRFCVLPFVIAMFLAVAPPAASAQQALPDLSLEELLQLDSGRVFGASLRDQPVTEAPSSVTFITADQIERFGYRSLADILRAIRSFYVTNDRNFSYLGARGFGKPGDYNSRVLLLVNGHRVNDNVFGQAEIGPEFGIDPAMFERIEIIRGPGSALYGDSAFFAVVNVITKSAAALPSASVTVEGASLGIDSATVSISLCPGHTRTVTGWTASTSPRSTRPRRTTALRSAWMASAFARRMRTRGSRG